MTEARKHNFSIQVMQIIDALLVLAAFLLGVAAWNSFLAEWSLDFGLPVLRTQVDSTSPLSNLLFLAVPFTPICLEMFGFYSMPGRQSPARALWRILQALITIFLAISVLSLVIKFAPDRPTLVVGLLFSAILLWTRECLFFLFRRLGFFGEKRRTRLLLAGRKQTCDEWWQSLSEDDRNDYEVVGRHQLTEDQLSDLSDKLKETAAERVVFLARSCPFEILTAAMEECEIQGVEVWLAADFVRARIAQPSFDVFGNTPMLVLRSTPSLSWSLLAKETFDRLASAILLLIFSLPMMAVAIGIKLSDKGPVFYRQERAGKYGRPFMMWKFRTMIVDADAKLEELKKQAGNQMDGPVFKLEHDPRIFPFGRFLRKFSVDELPQLFNVLFGDMSLVGPRPMAVYELPDIEKSEHRRKLSVKPGITCIWQVSGRNEITSFDEWVKLDLQYIDNWSLWLDFKLLLLTIPAVLFAKGAK